MPIEHRHDTDRNLLVVTLRGDVSDADLAGYAAEVIADDAIDADTDDYVDLSEVTALTVTGEGLRRFNDILGQGGRIRNPGRMAIYAPTDLTFGMGRMFELGRGDTPIEVRVFRGQDEARAWIGLPPA